MGLRMYDEDQGRLNLYKIPSDASEQADERIGRVCRDEAALTKCEAIGGSLGCQHNVGRQRRVIRPPILF